jgi:hypothetical protein
MRERFQLAAAVAGYDENYFGFHSLRSGFLCSAIVNATQTGKSVSEVIEETGIIGRWQKPEVQRRYIKETQRRTSIASRLITGDSTSILDPKLLEAENYHGVKLVPKEPSLKKMRVDLNQQLVKRIKESEFYKADNPSYLKMALDAAYASYTADNYDLDTIARHKEMTSGTPYFNAKMEVGREYIGKLIKDEGDEMVPDLVDNLFDRCVYWNNKRKIRVDYPEREKTDLSQIGKRERDTGGKRKAVRWTEEELGILHELHEKHGNQWAKIAKKLANRMPRKKRNGRTNTDCWDRIRTEAKQAAKKQ